MISFSILLRRSDYNDSGSSMCMMMVATTSSVRLVVKYLWKKKKGTLSSHYIFSLEVASLKFIYKGCWGCLICFKWLKSFLVLEKGINWVWSHWYGRAAAEEGGGGRWSQAGRGPTFFSRTRAMAWSTFVGYKTGFERGLDLPYKVLLNSEVIAASRLACICFLEWSEDSEYEAVRDFSVPLITFCPARRWVLASGSISRLIWSERVLYPGGSLPLSSCKQVNPESYFSGPWV